MSIDKIEIREKLNLVLNKLQNLERPKDEEKIAGMAADGGESIGLFKRDFGMEPWDWPQGVGLYGMYSIYSQTGDEKVKDYIFNWYKKNVEGENKNNLPKRNINTSAPLLTLSFIADELGEEYKALCEDWVSWIVNELPKTKENGFQHTTTGDAALGTIRLNEGEVWIDTLFMCVLFTAKMGVVLNNDEYLKVATHQVLLHIKYLYEKKNGLFYHGYTFIENNNFGDIHWGRGNSWFTSCAVDFLEIMGDKIDGGVREFIIDTYKAQVDALVKLQAPSGLWNTVLDDATSYEEVSGTAGFTYGMLKGIRVGIVDKFYLPFAEKAIKAIVENIDEEGLVRNVSAGTAMGFDAEHYKNIIKAPMAYGQSLTIMALAEYLKK